MYRVNYIQPNNPTYEERKNMVKIALEEVGRLEDFDNLLELLAPPKEITNVAPPGIAKGKGIKIGIIGAGVAGLSAAFELRKLGFDITIFEQQKHRIGGRIYTYYFDKERDLYGELGAMRIPVIHESTWHYIDLFKLPTSKFVDNNSNAYIYARNIRVRNDSEGIGVSREIYPQFNLTPAEKQLSWRQLIGLGLEKELYKLDPSTRRELVEIKKEYSPKINALGDLSIRRVMELNGLSEGAMELIASVSSLLRYFYYNSYIENLQEQYTIDYAFRYYINGGFSNLSNAFYNSLISESPKEYTNIPKDDLGTVTFKMGRSVNEMHFNSDNNKVSIYYSTGDRPEQVYSEEFDYVVCAIPFSSLRNIDLYPMFSTDKMQAIRDLNYTQSQKTLFLCNDRFWEEEPAKIVGGSSTTDLVISTIWYPNNPTINSTNRRIKESKRHKRKVMQDNPGVLLASYNLNQDAIRLGNNQPYIDRVKRQVENVHGLPLDYLNSVVEDYKLIQWDQEDGFFGAFCYYLPQQQRLFAYSSAKSEYDEKVYFAGEHVSTAHGWLQGSFNSAMKAANDIAVHYKNNFIN